MSKGAKIMLEIANSMVISLWVKCLITDQERDKILEKNKITFI